MARIKVTMLGQFSISYKDKSITEYDSKGYKMRLLLQYLIAHRERGVSQSVLIDLLWQDSDNPAGALKTLVHRTREMLTDICPEGKDFIISRNNSYGINPDLDIEIDSGEFLHLMDMANDENLSRTKRVHLYISALELYKGEYLMNSATESWVMPISVYFHSIYISALQKCVDLLYPMGKFDKIIQICEKAMILNPADENVHESLIRALVAIGEYELAAKQYEYLKNLLMEQYSSAPSSRLTELYELTVKPRNDAQRNISAIIGELTESGKKAGCYFCEYEVFKYIFRLYSREQKRLKSDMCMFLVTLTEKEGKELEDKKLLKKAMDKLSECIVVSLRSCDIYTRYSRCQYILLLPDAKSAVEHGVKSRISSKFNRYGNRMNVALQFDFRELPVNSD